MLGVYGILCPSVYSTVTDEKLFVDSGLAILFRPLGFIAPKTIIWVSSLSILSMHGGFCSRDESCALILIYMSLLSSQK